VSAKETDTTNDGGARLAEIPTGLDELLGYSSPCSCGKIHSVELKQVAIRPGAVDQVVAFARDVGRRLVVCVAADRVTWQVAGERVSKLLASDGHATSACILPDGAGGRPHADEENLALVERALEGSDLGLAVGSGTVNDLVKLASYRRGIPYMVVASAPSMNGYTSAIAAIMLRGIKRTVACHQPLAVVADLDILCAAPHELAAAGLGDLESKPTATADFRLAGKLRGAYYCPAPERVVLGAEARVAEAAADIGRGDPQALALLAEALLLSGISMKLAGTSSPASGGEHLISHFWDMSAQDEGRVEGLHGAQVGVATIVSAALYEALQKIDPARIDIERIAAAWPSSAEIAGKLGRRHGKRTDEVREEYLKKHLEPDELRGELSRIRDSWDDLWSSVGEPLRRAKRVREILAAGGAPTTIAQLGLNDDHLRLAFLSAREIRGRFTVLDLAAELGVLEHLRDEILDSSGCLSGL